MLVSALLPLLSFLPCLHNPPPFYFPSPAPTDVLDGVGSPFEGDDGGEGERGEEEGRVEEEQLDLSGGGDDDGDEDAFAATSASALVTNPPPLEENLPATSSTPLHLELTNPDYELTSLGKMHWLWLCGAAWFTVLSLTPLPV